MELFKICLEVTEVEGKLMTGEALFQYDSMMCALKPGHPAEILDDIIAQIFWDAKDGKEPEAKVLKDTLRDLKAFKRAFQVKELKTPIKHLDEYINPKTPFTFNVEISPCGETEVEYPVTQKELQLIRQAQEDGECFEDAEKLASLYKRVMKAGLKQIKEDLDLTNDDIDPDELEYCIDFGEEA